MSVNDVGSAADCKSPSNSNSVDPVEGNYRGGWLADQSREPRLCGRIAHCLSKCTRWDDDLIAAFIGPCNQSKDIAPVVIESD